LAPDEIEIAAETLYPNSRKWLGGGCVVEMTRKAEVLFCEQCRWAEDEWWAKNGKRFEAGDRINEVMGALDEFAFDVGYYPRTAEALSLLKEDSGDEDWNGPYLKEEIQDPWGRPLIYTPPTAYARAEVCTLGEDGKPGGELNDKDQCVYGFAFDWLEVFSKR
jgi:type II secretion system protein G